MKTTAPLPILLAALFLFGCEHTPPVAFAPTNFDPSVPWQRVNGPNGGSVISVAISGTTTLAGTQSGIFLSTNRGTDWVAANADLPPYGSVVDFTILGDTLFAATTAGVLRSTDGGANWLQFGSLSSPVNQLAITDSAIFAATGNGVFVFSRADVSGWVPAGLRSINVSALVGNTTYLFAGTYGYGPGFARSTDRGTTWTITNGGPGSGSINALALSGATLLAGTDDGLYSSTDDGSTWVRRALNAPSVGRLVVDGGRILAATQQGIFLSTDSGKTWSPSSFGPANTGIAAISVKGTYWIAGTYDGPYVSTNDGSAWTLSNSGLTNAEIHDIAVSGSNLLAGVSTKGILVSTNQGKDWEQTGLSSGYVANFTDCAGYDFATVFDGIYRSTDHGMSWYRISRLSESEPGAASMTSDGMRLYAGNYAGIYVSTDYGLSWSILRPRFRNSSIYFLAAEGNYVYAGGYDGVYRSSDNGNTWTELVFNIPYPAFYALGICRGTILLSTYGNGLFLSNDHGTSWTAVNSGILQYNPVREFKVVGTDIFASTSTDVMLSRDNGGTWVSTGLAKPSVTGLASDGTYLYAGTPLNGIWKHPL